MSDDGGASPTDGRADAAPAATQPVQQDDAAPAAPQATAPPGAAEGQHSQSPLEPGQQQQEEPSSVPSAASSASDAKWKDKAMQLREHLDATAGKLQAAQREAADAERRLKQRHAAEVAEKEVIIRQLRARAQEFLKTSEDKSRARAAEVQRLEGVVRQHEAAAQQSRLRRSRPIQVALRIQDTRAHGDVWCLVDYQKPTLSELGNGGGGGGGGGGGDGDADGAAGGGGSAAVISEWERQDVVVARVRQAFGLELALPPVITSADILELRERIRALGDELADSKEAYRKYRVRQELALRQQTTELKQARKELDKNFSMRVRHIAETDMEGELKTCRRQLKWLEEENQVSQARLADARNALEMKTMEAKGLSEQLLERAVELERVSDQLQKTQQAHRKQALAGAIALMASDNNNSNKGEDGGSSGGNAGGDEAHPEASMTAEELRRHFAAFKLRAKKVIADKARQVDAARSQAARLEHRLASMQQFKDRGYDIDVSMATATADDAGVGGGGAGKVEGGTRTPVKHGGGGGGGDASSPSSVGSASTTGGGGGFSEEGLSAQEALAKVEYLRNLVLQYMTGGDASTRQQMEVTIGSILKFSPRDLQRLREKARANASPAASLTGKLWGMFGKR